jgi:phosphoribosylpyrophosphate synthetase
MALTRQVANYLDVPVGNMKLNAFSVGEIQLEINESIRGEP